MRTFAIANQKGGTGKTTTAVTLAHALAQDGYRVLLMDTDTQGNVADSLGLTKAPGISRLVQWYSDQSTPLLVVNARQNLDVIPSDATTAQAKERLVSLSFREQVLRSALEHMADRYDVAVIDCAPSVDVLHVAALTAADWLVIPTSLRYLAVAGVNGVVHFLNRMSQRSPRTATLLGILPTFFDRRTNETLEQLDNLLKAFSELVLPPIPIDVKLAEAPASGQTIWEYAPGTRGIVGFAGRNGNRYGGYERFISRVRREL